MDRIAMLLVIGVTVFVGASAIGYGGMYCGGVACLAIGAGCASVVVGALALMPVLLVYQRHHNRRVRFYRTRAGKRQQLREFITNSHRQPA